MEIQQKCNFLHEVSPKHLSESFLFLIFHPKCTMGNSSISCSSASLQLGEVYAPSQPHSGFSKDGVVHLYILTEPTKRLSESKELN